MEGSRKAGDAIRSVQMGDSEFYEGYWDLCTPTSDVARRKLRIPRMLKFESGGMMRSNKKARTAVEGRRSDERDEDEDCETQVP